MKRKIKPFQPKFPVGGTEADILRWAGHAKLTLEDSERRVQEFQDSLNTQSRWTQLGLFNFIKENSQLKALMEAARSDDVQPTQMVILTDTGNLKGFEYKDGSLRDRGEAARGAFCSFSKKSDSLCILKFQK
jgi:hypothetical protein